MRLWRSIVGRDDIKPDDLSHVIGTIYDCAVDPQYWPKAIESIARLVDGVNGLILMLDTVRTEARLHVDWNMGPEATRVYDEKYHKGNPLAEGILRFDVDQPYSIATVMDVEDFK